MCSASKSPWPRSEMCSAKSGHNTLPLLWLISLRMNESAQGNHGRTLRKRSSFSEELGCALAHTRHCDSFPSLAAAAVVAAAAGAVTSEKAKVYEAKTVAVKCDGDVCVMGSLNLSDIQPSTSCLRLSSGALIGLLYVRLIVGERGSGPPWRVPPPDGHVDERDPCIYRELLRAKPTLNNGTRDPITAAATDQ
ncbi:hypothetical protein F2P81_002213 [Scophthalmus maximus]|uniref:Uncharacterized protein n=1 Tax=Scophthalmus maximus TaxID=52904 RepID=A0A6A4TR25_SCOMX|nr:hypothetical protein F2P81_002213 [Scophthalmus maximus]